jgi:hypothetical protein
MRTRLRASKQVCRIGGAAAALAMGVTILGCGGSSGTGTSGSASTSGGMSTGAANATPAPISGTYSPKIDPANFVSKIDNRDLPYKPGRTAVLTGVAEDGKTPQTDTETVTSAKKKIMGVECTVVRDFVSSKGQPIERTDDWYAQDRQGNVWYFGEASFERKFKHGGYFAKVADSWKAGVDGAKPGIVMLADPHPGDAYRQEYYIGHAEDQARVLGQGGAVKVPQGSFPQTLVTLEYSNTDHQYEKKWYAPGVGEIKEAVIKGSHEHFELTKTT